MRVMRQAGAGVCWVAVALAGAGCARAGTVGPDELVAAVQKARPGETITLEPGLYGAVTLQNIKASPAITIDARAAQFQSLVLRRVEGITLRGGSVISPPHQFMGIVVDYSKHVTLTGWTITGARTGVSLSRGSDMTLADSKLTGLRSDGVVIAMSQRVLIENNVCTGFNPVPPVYDANAKLLKDGDHPDCIQAWSRPNFPPTSDIVIRGNRGEGRMQGVWFGNGVVNGVNEGGFDRITVEGNEFALGAYNGIVLYDARTAVIRNNAVRAVPGMRNLFPPFKAPEPWIRTFRSTDVTGCGNTVEASHSRQVSVGTKRC